MGLHRLASLAAAAVCLAATTSAPPAAADEPDAARITLPVREARLSNGLRVVLQEDHTTPIVALSLWYHVGSKDEVPGRQGFAHLFEHMMFQGSKHVPDVYNRYLERSGASNVNATTNLDRTNYFETVPRNRLELALWLESDRMGFLLDHLDARAFAGQRDVVKNERRQRYEGAPYGLVGQFLAEALYPPTHPYHHLTIGAPADLDAATLDDVRLFFRTYYAPNDATLVLAGDLEPAAAMAMIEKYFGPIPAGPAAAVVQAPRVELAGEKRITIEAGVELGRVVVEWPTPPFFAPGDGDLDLLARVLSSGGTSRLYKRLVYDDQIAQDVSAHQGSSQLGSVFEISATVKPGHTAAEVLAAIDQELERVRSGGVTAAELARARTETVAGRAFGLEDVARRADLLEAFVHYTGDAGYLAKDLGRYEAATAEGLRDAARTWLPAARRVVATVVPTKGAPLSGRLAAGTP